MKIDSLTTPTSFLFFAAAAVLQYNSSSSEASGLQSFAHSAYCFFILLGPLNWIGRAIVLSPQSADNGSLAPIGDLLQGEKTQNLLRFFLFTAQGAALLAGISVLSYGIF